MANRTYRLPENENAVQRKSSLHFGGFKVQAAFLLGMYGRHLCLRRCRLPHAKNACIPHTPYTLVLEFVPPAGRVCGVATHAVGGDAGYGLLYVKRSSDDFKVI